MKTRTTDTRAGIVGVYKPAKVRTTIPAEHNPPLLDLVGRRFAPGKPDVACVTDIERHEALFNLAVVKGHSGQLVGASDASEGSLILAI